MPVGGGPARTAVSKGCPVFRPKKIVVMSSNLSGVPGWSDVPQCEIDRYAGNLGPASVKKAGLVSVVVWTVYCSGIPVLQSCLLCQGFL